MCHLQDSNAAGLIQLLNCSADGLRLLSLLFSVQFRQALALDSFVMRWPCGAQFPTAT